MTKPVSIVWFRRDLRLEDHTALYEASETGLPILPVFIFDTNIVAELPVNDARITFIHQNLLLIKQQLMKQGSNLLVLKGDPLEVLKKLIKTYNIHSIFVNKDYEPYALQRDQSVKTFLNENGIDFYAFKDQVIFHENEVVKTDGTPYTVFTPYKNKWMEKWNTRETSSQKFPADLNFFKFDVEFPSLIDLGFETSSIKVKPFTLENIPNYSELRDLPALDSTSYLSPHLRFGTVSIRQIIQQIDPANTQFLNELIWREFFMQILFHFPHVVTQSFKPKYDHIKWRNNEAEFQLWCDGKTGYPIVDAGMRQLNLTGYIHNRVRMITAGFLCKHLLIDWRWGEAYFARKLLDYELSSNNGNWQWAAGTGCDAAPYFRIFNPTEQLKKFDKNLIYIKRWIPEWNTLHYPQPMVDHTFARNRAIEIYKKGLI